MIKMIYLYVDIVISKIVLKEHSKRKRARRPKRNGQVFVDKKTRQCAAHLLEAHQLGGTRLRNWAISQHPPGRIIHLITPVRETAQNRHVVQFSPESLLPDQNGTESTDLLELGKAIAQRIKRRSQRDVIIDLPKIRTNKRSKRTAQS